MGSRDTDVYASYELPAANTKRVTYFLNQDGWIFFFTLQMFGRDRSEIPKDNSGTAESLGAVQTTKSHSGKPCNCDQRAYAQGQRRSRVVTELYQAVPDRQRPLVVGDEASSSFLNTVELRWRLL